MGIYAETDKLWSVMSALDGVRMRLLRTSGRDSDPNFLTDGKPACGSMCVPNTNNPDSPQANLHLADRKF